MDRKSLDNKNDGIDIRYIEKKIDEIIAKNKKRLNAEQGTKIDLEEISLKSKKLSKIYFLKKSDKKQKKDENISGKIIEDARVNLGEDYDNIKEIGKIDDDLKIENIKPPKSLKEPNWIKSSKTNEEELNNTELQANTVEEVVGSNNFNEIVDELEEIDNNKTPEKKQDDFQIIDKKIQEIENKKTNETKEVNIEEKALNYAKSHDIFNKDIQKNDLDLNENKNIDDLKQKYKENLVINDEPEDEKFIDQQLSDLKNKEQPIPEKDIKNKKPTNPFVNKKPFFNRHEKSPLPSEEKIEAEKPKKGFIPSFKVENRPDSLFLDSEKKLIDEKIKNTNNEKSEKNPDFVEEKAANLAQKHIKEKSMNLFNNKDNSKMENPQAKKADQELIFFDEDSAFEGWSPKNIEKDNKNFALNLHGEPEITPDGFGETKDIELPKDVLNIKSTRLTDLGFSENEWEELDFYPLHEPFAYVEILREKETLEKRYFLVEIELTSEEREFLDFINETMRSLSIDTEELEEKGDEKYFVSRVNKIIEEYDVKISDESLTKILYYLGKSSLGLSKIDPVMKDPNIEDISCDGSGIPLFLYHRQYGSLKSNIVFTNEDDLASFVFKLAQKCGKHISIAEPILDATMPDGSRVQMTLSDEITARGSTFTIRKFRSDPFSPPDLVEFNTMSSEMVSYMWMAIENGINTLFAGGTASGKTTALNALSLFIPSESKIVSIEETREINLPHPNWIPGVARSGFGEVVADKMVGEIDMYDLMKAALRQRPEFILVGEIRGREAYVLFQAMATGHATYSTVHADSAQSLIHRLEGKPINIPRVMLQSLDVVSLHIITRVKNKRARRCKQIIEIIDIDPTTKEILTNEVFRWDPVEDKFFFSGKSYVLEKIRAEKDLSREQMTNEIKNRMTIVEWMNQSNIRGFRDVAKLVAQYQDNPTEVVKKISKVKK